MRSLQREWRSGEFDGRDQAAASEACIYREAILRRRQAAVHG